MNKSKSGLFLMELIFAILIFSLASAVCIQIFVKAHTISESTQELNKAVTLCSDAAELFYGYDGDMSKVIRELDSRNTALTTADGIIFFYDENYLECDSESAAYRLVISRAESTETLVKYSISLLPYESEEPVYSIPCSLYVERIYDVQDSEDSPDTDVIPDAGVVPDGDVVPDAGVVPDGDVVPDAGVVPDGDVVPDAGVVPDGGGAAGVL